MCGIIGYTGLKPAQPILLNGLARLEYRGYDSCGIALSDHGITVYKDAIRVAALKNNLPFLPGTSGIGHTRWATHGAPNQINAHPHTDCTGRIAVVHNGVINNYSLLRKRLTAEGHHFTSETDTEVICHLVESNYHGNLSQAVALTLKEIEGSYAIIVMIENSPELVFARQDSPLILGIGDRENFIASDVPALMEYTNRVIYLENGDTGVVTPSDIHIFQKGQPVKRIDQKILWTAEQAQKGGYSHFLLKEIHEQPRVIRDTIAEYLAASEPILDICDLKINFPNLLLLGCGTSYHAALVGKYFSEQLQDIPIRVEMASEFNYYNRCPAATLGVGITQSGETADTLKAMRRLKETGSYLVSITNVVASTASKIADKTVYTRAGPEMSVAATKSFTAQLIALYWILISLSHKENPKFKNHTLELRQLPDQIQRVLDTEDQFTKAAETLANYENAFYIGRGINYPIALEGALKLKEVSYIHCEGCAAGEMKHGTFALLGHKLPVIAFVAMDTNRNAVITNLKEIKSRGSPIFAIASEDDQDVNELADIFLPVPETSALFSPFVNTVAAQLLAYYAANKLGCPIDYPRNLAKSVTVE